jgi:phage tail tape-measure protein
LAGVGAGAGIGALVGSIVPGPGTLIGAAVGATIGGIIQRKRMQIRHAQYVIERMHASKEVPTHDIVEVDS